MFIYEILFPLQKISYADQYRGPSVPWNSTTLKIKAHVFKPDWRNLHRMTERLATRGIIGS